MRLRFAVLGSLLATLAIAVVPAVSGAAPRHNHGLTINATPNPIDAGDGVLIYGQLNAAPVAGQTIVLYHHIAGSHQGFTEIGRTTTDSTGFYSFTRAVGIVETNRSWFVRELGAAKVHSRTVRERVRALVSIDADKTTVLTRHPVVFTGHVAPNHASERVLLQEQKGNSDDWTTIDSGRLGPDSNYRIVHRWRVPNAHVVRVVFPGDDRNYRGVSDTATITVQQAQHPSFTINSSDPIITYGGSATISGVLSQPGTTTPEPNTAVVLCSRGSSGPTLCSSTTTTGSDGSYSFNVSPTRNELYQVRTTLPPHRSSALLFEGVRDVVTLSSSSSTSTVGGHVTFTGGVTPDKAGHVIYLEKQGADGDFHVVEVRHVQSDATFQFGWTFGSDGTKVFRVRIPGGPVNLGNVSPPVTITVSGVAPVSSLPPAS